jgi:hypothetical protein
MEPKLDKKALEWACKQLILTSAKNSKYLKENSESKERILFAKWVKGLTYNQTLGILFEQNYKPNTQKIRDIEDAYAILSLLGFASYLGTGAATLKNIFQDRTGRAGIYFASHILTTASMILYYKYKQYKDPCYQKCKNVLPAHIRNRYEERHSLEDLPEYNVCTTKCALDAAINILRQIKGEKGKCSRTEKPEKCIERLNKLEIKWTEKVKDLKDSLIKYEKEAREERETRKY